MPPRRPTYLCNLDQLAGPNSREGQCDVAPPGWWCPLDAGHEAPCNTYPFNDDPRLKAGS